MWTFTFAPLTTTLIPLHAIKCTAEEQKGNIILSLQKQYVQYIYKMVFINPKSRPCTCEEEEEEEEFPFFTYINFPTINKAGVYDA